MGLLARVWERFHSTAAHQATSFLVEKTKDIVIFIRTDGTIEAVNPAFSRQLGWKESDVRDKALTQLSHDPASREALQAISGLDLPDWEGPLDLKEPSGQPVPAHGIFRRVYNPEREAVGGVLLLYDLRTPHETLDHEKEDQLTALSNRRWVLDLLEVEFQRFIRYGGNLSVLWIRLGGNQVTDEMFRQAGAVLKAGLRRTDFCGRIGERDFLVVLPETPVDRSWLVSGKLRRLISAVPFEVDDQEITIDLGIGVASLEASDSSTEVFLDRCQKSVAGPLPATGPLVSTGT